jgi:20S proteasome alpha/beta subunit
MTLTVCLQGKDMIVVATDSRGTFGDPRGATAQNDNIKKLYIVGNIVICSSGTSYHTNIILEEVEVMVTASGLTGVTDIMQKVRDVANKRFNEWFPGFPLMSIPGQNPAFVRPLLELSIAGYDFVEKRSIPRMYSLSSIYHFAPTLHDYGFILSGVPQYALYLLNRLYSPDMDVKALEHLAAYVITETATQDGKVGGRVQMAIISPNSGASMLNNDDIDLIVNQNEDRAKGLKDIFTK